LHEAGIPHGQLGATSIVLRDDGPVLVDLGLDTRLDPAYEPKQAMQADLLALQQVMGFAASGPGNDGGEETQALAASAARLINALSQANSIGDAVEAIDRLVEDSAKTGIDTQPALTDFMTLLEASDYSSGVYRRLDVPPKTEVSERVLSVSSVEGKALTDSDSDPELDQAPTRVDAKSSSAGRKTGKGAKRPDLLTSQDVALGDDSGRHVPLVPPPDVSQEGLFESEERTTPLVEAPEPYPRRLGEYVLLEEIGKGPGGTVHLARAQEAQNLVALRTLNRKHYKRDEDLQKLWRKVDATASLENPVFARSIDRGAATARLVSSTTARATCFGW
ncbi:MAG: hypothetical protein KC619_09415, partial [Myxococcales bacterium]|nr:hypothetical protein [Myxococcales bacterium]